MRDLQFPGRSPVLAMNALAATSHPLATSAAVDCMRRGGNAVDAAVTAAGVLSVVEPAMTGIGGDCFAIIGTPDGQLHGINGSGRAAKGVSTDWMLAQGFNSVPLHSPHAVTVPGAVRGFEHMLKRFGRWGFADVLAPAIKIAEEGHPVASRVAYDWANEAEHLKRIGGATAKHYLKDGAAPRVGDVVRYPALARSLKIIAEKGAAGFYEGELAEDMVATLNALGNHLTLDDFAHHEANDFDPVSSMYRDLEVAELPPNGQGIAALIILNILKCFDLARLDPNGPERLHLEMEAARLGYACRDAFIADPAHMRVSVADLISDSYGATLAARINPTQRLEDVTPSAVPGSDTVYLTVVDKDRLAVSLIYSVYSPFGSGIATDKTGILFQNRGACFVVKPGHANTIEGGKRPMHTIIPAFARKNGRNFMPFGVMGGAYQAAGHAHVISNIVDYGMDAQEAIDAPRIFWGDDRVTLRAERSVPEATVQGLIARGHKVERSPGPIGGSQIIQIDEARGVLVGGSDPRKDGCALGF